MEDFPDIPLNRNEAYKLRVTSKGVEIEAITETGVYRAIQTLRQLTEKKGNGIAITGCEITDWPAFRIRGFMQDVGRTYISTDELKREIDDPGTLQDKRLSLAPDGKSGMAPAKQGVPNAERQRQHDPPAGEILHAGRGTGIGRFLQATSCPADPGDRHAGTQCRFRPYFPP